MGRLADVMDFAYIPVETRRLVRQGPTNGARSWLSVAFDMMTPSRHHRKFGGRWDVTRGKNLLLWQRITPPQLFVGSFALLILLGTIGLRWIPGLVTVESVSWLDALFAATSAVCVTGFTLHSTPTYFTPAGQAYLLLFVQLGGLGMISFASLIILALGGRLSLRQEALTATPLDGTTPIHASRLILDIIRFTLVLEGMGTVLLYLLWVPRFGFGGALWPALFHSVNAFCNAGFSTFSNSLMDFQTAPFSLAVIMTLVVLGGLGFLTLEELWLHYRATRRKATFRLSLHSRIVLCTTVVLLLGGGLLYGLFEWNGTLRDLGIVGKISNAMFMSANSRTGGFYTIDYARASDSTNFLTILLMMIGGSPGSTAGGMKTTTFALIGLLAWSRYRGREHTSAWSRSLREDTTDRAVGLFVMAFGVVTLGILALTVTEQVHAEGRHFLRCMLEAASAFNTAGLSMDYTKLLSTPGKWIVILLMFVGRVGPLTFAAALVLRRTDRERFRYAYEDVAVG